MKEEFLHYLWKNKLLNSSLLKTTDNHFLKILDFGFHNHNAGPDFLNSKIEIEEQVWFGNIEIHVKSSDWYLHQHETDVNYDTVILHVVWDYDADIYMKNNIPIPTLELKNYVDKTLVEKYHNLKMKALKWIPCEKEIGSIDSFYFNHWLERLFIERLEKKSMLIQELLWQSQNDWETVLFQMLAKGFGLKINGEAFLNFSKSFSCSILRKEQDNLHSLSALFFGQAGFLSEEIENPYHRELREEYLYLKYKYQLKPIAKNQFQFFRMRPSNFPTIRMAQLIALYHAHQNLFSKLIELKSVEGYYKFFKIEIDSFWETHYTFEKESKSSKKQLSKPFLDLLLINTIIPLQFSYQKSTNTLDEDSLFTFLKQLKPEKNSIISKFLELGITAKDALETQALLQLKNNYCASKRCLECAIGHQLLKK